jgi:hypothetical protein
VENIEKLRCILHDAINKGDKAEILKISKKLDEEILKEIAKHLAEKKK